MHLTWMINSLGSFIAELSLSKSGTTVLAYRHDVACFLDYLCERSVKRIAQMKPHHIVEYLSYCKEGGKSDASLNRYYMSIRAYCKHLRKSKQISFDLTEDITAPRNPVKAPHVPTIAEMATLVAQPSKHTETESRARDKAMLTLLYSSGLRASELCDLKIEDFKENGVQVKAGKRGKTRTVPITVEAAQALSYYIENYRGKERGYLFQTLMGKQIRRQLLCKIVCLYAKEAGLENVTTHTLRHACATHLLDEGADLRLIQEVLGHSSIASTQRYTHLSSNKMQEMFQQFHPRRQEAVI